MECKICGNNKFETSSSLVTGSSIKGEGTDRLLLKCTNCGTLNSEMKKIKIPKEGRNGK